tara:strand:+ start:370 stop:717 length:348 start_codon:yes stop_codon:yes gene_type:complete
MPVYQFKNPQTEETIEVIQSMKDRHVYVDEDGLEWERVFFAPNSSIDTKMDGSLESFMRKSQNKGGTLGDLEDMSREASEIRKKERGVDKVQQKYFKNYSEKRHGMKHQNDKGSP